MTFVDEKIKALSPQQRREFEEALNGIKAEDPSKQYSWLYVRGFDESYSLDMVKLTLYREMYEGDKSRLPKDRRARVK